MSNQILSNNSSSAVILSKGTVVQTKNAKLKEGCPPAYQWMKPGVSVLIANKAQVHVLVGHPTDNGLVDVFHPTTQRTIGNIQCSECIPYTKEKDEHYFTEFVLRLPESVQKGEEIRVHLDYTDTLQGPECSKSIPFLLTSPLQAAALPQAKEPNGAKRHTNQIIVRISDTEVGNAIFKSHSAAKETNGEAKANGHPKPDLQRTGGKPKTDRKRTASSLDQETAPSDPQLPSTKSSTSLLVNNALGTDSVPSPESLLQRVDAAVEELRRTNQSSLRTIETNPYKALGATFRPPQPENPPSHVPGLWVATDVDKTGQAAKLGVRVHDCLYQINGVTVLLSDNLMRIYTSAKLKASKKRENITVVLIPKQKATR